MKHKSPLSPAMRVKCRALNLCATILAPTLRLIRLKNRWNIWRHILLISLTLTFMAGYSNGDVKIWIMPSMRKLFNATTITAFLILSLKNTWINAFSTQNEYRAHGYSIRCCKTVER